MDPKEAAAQLVNALAFTLAADTAYKAEVAAAIVDEMLGTNPHAIVSQIRGIPPELFELISDGLVQAIKAEAIKRLTTTP